MPWSSGPRTCPGQRMSQVEFVSVIMTLFGRCSVEPVVEEGESVEQAREKLLRLLQDSQPVLTLQINRPKKVRLKWVSR
jgi:cytochrome P450